MSKKGSSSILLPAILLGGLGILAFEKSGAVKEAATNWRPAGFKIRKLSGTKLECELPIEFTNTSRQSVSFDALVMNVRFQGESIAFVNLQQPKPIAAQRQTIINVPVNIDLFTLLRKAVDWQKATSLLASLKGVSDWSTWFRKNLGLRDVEFAGNIVVAGVQKKIEFVQDLGNVTRTAA